MLSLRHSDFCLSLFFFKTLTWAWQTLPDVCADTKVASALGSLEVLALELERQG